MENITPSADGRAPEQPADFNAGVDALAERLAQELSPERIKAAVEAVFSPAAAATDRKPVTAGDLAASLRCLFVRHTQSREFAEGIRAQVAEADSSRLADLTGEIRRELAAVAGQTAELRNAVGKLAGRVLEAEARAKAAASQVFDEKISGEAYRATVGNIVDTAVLDALDAVPDEPRVRELAREAGAAAVTAGIGGEVLAARVRELASKVAGDVLESRLYAALGDFVTGEMFVESVRRLIPGAVAPAISERIGTAIAEHLVSEPLERRVKDLAGRVAGEVVRARQEEALAAYTSGEALAARVREVAGEVSAGAITRHLASDGFEEKVRSLACAAAADVLGARMSRVEEDLGRRVEESCLENELEELRSAIAERASRAEVGQLSAAAERTREELSSAVTELRTGLDKEVRMALDAVGASCGELSHRLTRQEADIAALPRCLETIGVVHQRLNRLDQSLDRLPPADQTNAEIAALRKSIFEAGNSIDEGAGAEDGAAGLRAVARQSLQRAGEHLEQIEAELAQAGAESRLRALIREETGGLDRDALRERIDERLRTVVLEMIRGGELQEQLKVSVRKALSGPPQAVRREGTRRFVKGGGMDLPGLAEAGPEDDAVAPAPAAPAGDLADDVLHRIIENDSFKLALDERFRIMLDYLRSEAIPEAVGKALKAAE